MRVRVNKIGSVTRRLELAHELTLSADIVSVEGAVIAGRVLNDKYSYNTLEDVHGRMMPVKRGDIVVGALGRRQALHGYAGVIPERLAAGEQIELLNLGGVMGRCISQNPEVGPPFEVEVLGQVQAFPDFQSRRGVPANIADRAARPAAALPQCPVVVVCGACMNSGKTVASSSLVSRLSSGGHRAAETSDVIARDGGTVAAATRRVGGGKLTGVSLLKDCLMLRDYGAACAFDFTDAGYPSTAPENAVAAARCIFGLLAEQRPDVCVIEMGDGIFGQYGVQQILADAELRGLVSVLVYCANDPAGAFGGLRELEEQYGLRADIVSGPVTDNLAGKQFVEGSLGVSALNARQEPDALAAEVQRRLAAREAQHAA
jgi:hypothetical protein